MKDFETIDCPICHLRNERFLFAGLDRLMGIKGEFRVIQCRQCGLIYINPQPTINALYKYYPSQYPGSSFSTLRRISAGQNFIDRILRSLYLGRFNKKIKAIERYHNLDPTTSVLDVGCGNGGFLYSLQKIKRLNGVGVEI